MNRLSKIKELFLKLKQGHIWMQENSKDSKGCESLIERAKPMINELETLGVSKTFSEALLILGASIDFAIVDQFEEPQS